MDKKIKVLLIEDDAFLAKMYKTKMAIEKIDIRIAVNGEQGLELAKEELADIILLDIILPKIDGWGVLEGLQADERTKNIPVIMLTNLGQKDDIEKGLSLGAADYLIKAHFTPTEVVKKIKDVLNK